MAVLIEIRGDQQREFRLGEDNTLGRSATATIQLNDPLVSREHATIRKTDEGYVLTDAGSSHGTYFGTERVVERGLEDGDEIILGATRLRFFRESTSTGGRRWNERVACDLEVTVTLPHGERFNGRATDMSVSGMRLELDRELEIDTEIELAIAFPDRWRRMRTRARVARPASNEHGIGVAFLFSSDQAQLTLAQEFALLLRNAQRE